MSSFFFIQRCILLQTARFWQGWLVVGMKNQ